MAVADPVPRMVAEPGGDDHRLVAAVRRGDDRAFELLYERYHRRIHAYVMGMVKDHGRAEDITQEVFVSALRRMRETERPIAFKPWVYEIAKNACIDQFRRSRRAQEVSLQADEGLNASDYGKLVGSEPTPDAAVAAKQDFDNLRGAFVGLSDTHHEILVMRELEGLSYREIGERLGMSRPAVESTLFRARRRLSEEYDDLSTGARCRRVQGLIETAASSRLGTREERRLSRHVAHCRPCRREALAAGLDESILTHVPLPRRAARKIAGLLPFPLLGRSRSGDGPGWSAQLPMLSDQLAGGWGKLAAAAAVVVAGVGASGVGTHVSGSQPDRDRPAAQERAATATQKAVAAKAKQPGAAPAAERRATKSRRSDRARARRDRRTGSDATGPAANGGGGGGQPTSGTGGTVPGAGLPAGTEEATRSVGETVESVGRATQPVTDTVERTVGGANETVGNATQPVQETVEDVTDTAGGAVQPVQDTADDVVDAVEGTTGSGLPVP